MNELERLAHYNMVIRLLDYRENWKEIPALLEAYDKVLDKVKDIENRKENVDKLLAMRQSEQVKYEPKN